MHDLMWWTNTLGEPEWVPATLACWKADFVWCRKLWLLIAPCLSVVVCWVGKDQHRLAHQCSPCEKFAHTWSVKLNIMGIWNGTFKVAFITEMGGAFMAYSSMLRCSISDTIKLQFAQHTYVLQYTNQGRRSQSRRYRGRGTNVGSKTYERAGCRSSDSAIILA